MARPHVLNVLRRDLVVPAHFNLLSQLAQILDQVVGKRIVIVENKNQADLRLGI